MKVFYHAEDLDGICSAAICRKHYPDAELVPCGYWYDRDRFNIEPNEPVIFVDYFPSHPDAVNELRILTDDITIIDHHDREVPYDYKGIIDSDSPYGACRMVHEYLNPTSPCPPAVGLIAANDVFDRSYESVRFIAAMYARNTHISNTGLWDNLLRAGLREIRQMIAEGDAIVRWKRRFHAKYLKSYGRVGTVADKFSCIFVNIGMSSDIFDSIRRDYYDLYIFGSITNTGDWRLTLSSEKTEVDVGKICAMYGGGGRSNVGGMAIANLNDLITFDNTNPKDFPFTKENYEAIDKTRYK